MKRLVVVLLALCTATSFLLAQQSVHPADAIDQARAAIKEKNYDAAIQVLQAAIPAAAEITNEIERHQAAGALHFYSAVAFSAKGDDKRTREQLEQFFAFQPNMRKVDPAKYDARFVKAFNEVAATLATDIVSDGSFDKLYPGFASYSGKQPRERSLQEWKDSPEFVLLATRHEKKDWESAHGTEGREKFLAEFWARRDPTPGDPRNEFRDEWNARVAFADQTWGTEKLRGSLTDRGRVFVLLGRPAVVKERAMNSKEVSITLDSSMLYREGGEIEVWHYLAEQLPVKISGRTLFFRFATQKYHGDHILDFQTSSQRALLAAAEASVKQKN